MSYKTHILYDQILHPYYLLITTTLLTIIKQQIINLLRQNIHS